MQKAFKAFEMWKKRHKLRIKWFSDDLNGSESTGDSRLSRHHTGRVTVLKRRECGGGSQTRRVKTAQRLLTGR